MVLQAVVGMVVVASVAEGVLLGVRWYVVSRGALPSPPPPPVGNGAGTFSG